MPGQAVARAHANVALVKYWGKRDAALNLPAMGSLSVTLADLWTETRVEFVSELKADAVQVAGPDGREDSAAPPRVSQFLDQVRARSGRRERARVVSRNNFPTGAGFASSASGFAALALAATHAAGLKPTFAELATLSRLGSGSAPRSLLGGFVELPKPRRDDGSDMVPVQVLAESVWPVAVVIAQTESAAKPVGSREGMQRAETSPYYAAWLAGAAADLEEARAAVQARDLGRLGELAEHNCLKMHAVMQTSRPAVLYWNAVTLSVMHAVYALRAGGVPAYFTIDAGPQVKVLCAERDAAAVSAALAAVPRVERVWTTAPGPGASLVAS